VFFGTPAFTTGQLRVNDEFVLEESKLLQVVRRRKPTQWFWADMTDAFGAWVTDGMLNQCFATMALTPRHVHQVLTKRPGRARAYVSNAGCATAVTAAAAALTRQYNLAGPLEHIKWPLPAVWLGTRVENQKVGAGIHAGGGHPRRTCGPRCPTPAGDWPGTRPNGCAG
jgi:protein gp37